MPRSSMLANLSARNPKSISRTALRARSHSRATVENLERRQLLSAAISGIVLQDMTGNGLTSDDHALKGQIVKLYRDTNGNGVLDANENKSIASKTSKANGTFCFNNLEPGNYLIADVPVKSIRTAPVSSNTYAVQVTSGTAGGYVFDNYVNTFNPKLLSGITYTIDGTKTVTTLTNNAHEGDTVTANFTVAKNSSVTLSLVSYHAPSASFDATTANQQVVADSKTGTFGPGAHSMTVTVPDCYFQIDFVGGTVITQFGPAGSNIFYQQEGRLISNANGGDHSCGCDCGCTPNTPQPSSISGLIYCDTNLNGAYDAGVDEAMAGQIVNLTGTTTAGASVTLTTTTANDGTFQFSNLAAGTYTVTEPQPGGHVDAKNFALVAAGNGTVAQNGTTDTISGITLAAGQNLTGYQFAEVEPGPISGTVWVDLNNDGVIDASEPRLPGVQIALAGTNDLGQPVAMTTTTDALGNYLFNVRPGLYSLTETQPAGYLEGKDILGSLGGDASVQNIFSHISLPGCDGAGAGYNFGEEADPASLCGRVFCDSDLSGSYSAGDDALAGVTVTLVGTTLGGQNINLTTVTANDGTYGFGHVVAGNYTLSETEPSGHVDAKNYAIIGTAGGVRSQAGSIDTVSTITLTAGTHASGYDFAEVSIGSISGTIWVDANGNGQIDQGEAKIANVALSLTGANDLGQNISASATTDAQGDYSFNNLRPGIYTVVETQPANYSQGKTFIGSLGGISSSPDHVTITLPGCENTGINYNFSELLPPSSISGRVFCDADLSGTYTTGDETLAGVGVVLTGTTLSGQNITLSTTTAADGTYSFTNLSAGSYKIVEAEPAGHVDARNYAAIGTAGGIRSQASAAGPDTVAGITLTGQNAIGYDFAEVSLGSISGTVWLDCNNDGKMNLGETGIANVKITLTGTDDLGNSVITTTTTDSNGNYSFTSLRPGTYTITETQPANLLEGKDVLGSLGGNASVQDVFSNVQLPGCDGNGTCYNFGEQMQPTCGLFHGATATIGFWNNKNGQALINSLNGGPNSTQLGNWLATNFPNLYSGFKGKTNSYIASAFSNDFNQTGQKLSAQILGCALAVYVTNSSLAGNVAAAYGFNVGTFGTGILTINVGSSGLAFGCPNNTTITIFQALQAANAQSSGGTLYGGNTNLSNMANTIFDAINQGGDIS